MTARSQPRKPYRLSLEPLEDRLAPAIFTVNSTLDLPDENPGDGFALTAGGSGSGVTTLRAAIMEANALPGADTINLPAGVYTLTIEGTGEDLAETGDLDIFSDITILGAGANLTIIEAGTTDSNGIDRVFHILNPSGGEGGDFGVEGTIGDDSITNVVMQGITIRHGQGGFAGGGGIKLAIDEAGPGNPTLTLHAVAIDNNTSFFAGGGLDLGSSTVTITDSTFSNNDAGEAGGGISNTFGYASITNSTFSGNTAGLIEVPEGGEGLEPAGLSFGGGAIFGGFGSGATVILDHVTVTDNLAFVGGGILNAASGSVLVQNSIIAENFLIEDLELAEFTPLSSSSGSDVAGAFTSLGNNLIGNGDGSTGFTDGVNGDQVGDSSSTINPLLGPLQDNGGPTLTHLPLTGSPAIDNASGGEGSPTTDQRGFPRPVGAGPDIGAVEVQGEGNADVAVDIVNANGFIDADKKFTYVIVVTNNGELGASNVDLLVTLPNGVKVKSFTTTQGTLSKSGKILSGELGSLGVNETATIEVVVKPKKAGLLPIGASVTANEPDPELSNNVDTALHYAGRPLFIDDRLLALLFPESEG